MRLRWRPAVTPPNPQHNTHTHGKERTRQERTGQQRKGHHNEDNTGQGRESDYGNAGVWVYSYVCVCTYVCTVHGVSRMCVCHICDICISYVSYTSVDLTSNHISFSGPNLPHSSVIIARDNSSLRRLCDV